MSCQHGGAAKTLDEEIPGRIVAPRDRSIAELADRHTGFPSIFCRYRRIGDEGGEAVIDVSVQTFFIAVYPRQRESRCQKLVGAAERKPLASAIRYRLIACDVEDRDAYASSTLPFELGDLIDDCLLPVLRPDCGTTRYRGCRNAEQHRTARHHCSQRRYGFGASGAGAAGAAGWPCWRPRS